MNLKFITDLIKKWFGKKDPDMPEEAKAAFRALYRLSQKTLAAYVAEADTLQKKIDAAKTAPKKNLYKRKFNKVKKKFQDELGRLNQIDQIMKDNNIDPPTNEDEEEAA